MNELWNSIKQKQDTIKFCLEITVTICTIISIILVKLTLNEMQINRNNAYMPSIVVSNSANVSFIDDNREATLLDNESVCLTIMNIGCGSAVNIEANLDYESYVEIINMLNRTDKNNIYKIKRNNNNNGFYLTINGETLQQTGIIKSEKVYLLPEAKESWNIYIDSIYMSLLNKALSSGNVGNNLPKTYLNIKYKDIQGIDYYKKIELKYKDLKVAYKNGKNFGSYFFYM